MGRLEKKEIIKAKREEEDTDHRGRGRKRLRKAAEDGSVEDEEVEEFFAIVKRVKTAAKYFRERDAGGHGDGQCANTASSWSPCFKLEDFFCGVEKKSPAAGIRKSSNGKQLGEDPDLNSKPGPDHDSDQAEGSELD